MTAPHPAIPGLIELTRDADGTPRLIVDGIELPYAIDGADPVSVDMDAGRAPRVRLTLVAHSLHVRDDLLAGVTIPGHELPADDEPQPNPGPTVFADGSSLEAPSVP